MVVLDKQAEMVVMEENPLDALQALTVAEVTVVMLETVETVVMLETVETVETEIRLLYNTMVEAF
jgi:hypothetical protein